MKKMALSGREYIIFSPTSPLTKTEWPIVILHGDSQMYQLMTEKKLLPMKHCLAVMILSTNRIDDFSPWPCKALNEKFPDFMGKADDYLKWTYAELLPTLRNEYPVTASADHTGMLGQSLGGLLNIYAYFSSCPNFFSYAACVSPSSWYPNLINRLQEKITDKAHKKWYISSGTKEGINHNDLKKHTVDLTQKIIHLLRENGHEVKEYWDNGSHHEFLEDRYERALSWLDISTL